ncbi:MMPL family transporter [Bacillus sp. PK3_68]|uniref:MMPL family transporter n=1 Tax=Bacillus sp. PK3_68 TaxID=2027408 RepID=UPI0026D3810D
MKKILGALTDWISTRKGMWTVLIIWLLIAGLLSSIAPSSRDYSVSSIESLPSDSPAIEAAEKVNQYFPNDEGVPAILVFSAGNKKIETAELAKVVKAIKQKQINHLKEIVPFDQLPPPAQNQFLSKDRSAAAIPLNFKEGLENDQLKKGIQSITSTAEKEASDLQVRVTGPAGIAVDTTALFSQADIVLLLSTVGLILVLLIVIYRSPLLAFIPLLASVVVYAVTDRILGLYGKAGLEMSSQSLSIMTILLFAAVTDYSLFVLARYREELKRHESKFEAMKHAMRETGEPVFFSGGTVLAAMLVLFFAVIGDYQNFAPIFATVMAVIMLASVTLVPALFVLFGRKAFWPKVPKAGDKTERDSGFWNRIARIVSTKPIAIGSIVIALLLLASLNVLNVKYEFNTLKSFPDNMPSLEGYEIIEQKFAAGDLAPTIVLFEGTGDMTKLTAELEKQENVAKVRLQASTENNKAHELSLSFNGSPYERPAMDALASLRKKSEKVIADSGAKGTLYFAGETAEKLDDRTLNSRDLKVIVLLETLLIFVMLVILTRSVKMPLYMVGTILLSFLAALGIGMFLTNMLFGIDAISTRVPLYSFIFLVALGIDYNIILVSRYMEERSSHSLKKAVNTAVAKTGGLFRLPALF